MLDVQVLDVIRNDPRVFKGICSLVEDSSKDRIILDATALVCRYAAAEQKLGR